MHIVSMCNYSAEKKHCGQPIFREFYVNLQVKFIIMGKLTIHTTNYLRSGYEENDITAEDYISAIAIFDEQGNLISENTYNADTTLQSAVTTSFNENHQPLVVNNYDGEGQLCERVTNVYEDNRLVEQKVCYGEDMPEYSTRLVYENDLLVRRDCYDEDEFSYTERKLSYNDKAQLVKDVEFDEDGNEMYVVVNEYDEEGRLIARTRDEVQQHDRRSVNFEYDERGNKIKDLIYNYDEALIAKIYSRYDEENRLVELEEEDLDHYRLTKYEYEGKNPVKISMYDKEGKILNWVAYTYDNHGRVLTQEAYANDEVNPSVCRLVSHVSYTRE